MKQKLIYLALILGLIGGLIVRLKDLSAPLADWHSFRQADTASVAREYVKHGIDLLHPKYHDLSNIQSGRDNPEGYRMVEFPLISGLVALIYRTFNPGLELHLVYRLVNILLSLVSALFLFAIIKKVASPTMGLLAALVFLFLPFNIFYSRTILPEVALITFSLAGVFTALNYVDRPNPIRFILAFIMLATGLLVKPVAVFFYLPIVGYALDTRGIKSILNWRLLLLAVASCLPLYWWRQWIQAYPSGIPDSIWLLNGNHIRLKGAWFYWLFADRLGRLILGYWGTVFVALGLMVRKSSSLISWWVTGALLYLIIFASGNVQHDYYQIPLIPILSVLIAYGIHFFLTTKSFSKFASLTACLCLLTACFSFSWYHIRAYYGINNPTIITAGQAVDRLVPQDALVIAPYMGDTAFLYQTNRRGWPIGFEIGDKISKGAQYYVSVNYDDEANELLSRYQLVEKTDQYLILDLTKPISQPI